jgi:phage host-nuclease inhibitor protein Gam
MLMAVMMPREKWTDEHLDESFARLDADLRELRGEIKDLRTEMNARFDAINARFDAQNRNMMAGFLMVIVTILGSNAF